MARPEQVTDELVGMYCQLYADPAINASMQRVFGMTAGRGNLAAWSEDEARQLKRRALVFWSDHNRGQPPAVGEYVAEAVRVVRESGLPNRTDAMFTSVEGEWDEVMDVVKRATEAVGRYGSRVSLVLKADIRPGWTGQIAAKVARVEEHLAGDEA